MVKDEFSMVRIIINRKIILYHAIFWFFFVLYELGLFFILNMLTSSFADYLIHYILNIALFYVNAYIVLKCGPLKKTYFFLFIFLLLEMMGYLIINYQVDNYLEIHHILVSKMVHPLKLFIVPVVWRGIYFMALSTGYTFYVYNINFKKQIIDLQQDQLSALSSKNQLEKELLQSKNAILKMQVNPHMLFNTLNFIYNKVRKTSAEAGEAIMLLSEVSRYTYIATSHEELSSLMDEVEQIRNLIRLNQIRFDHELCITLKTNGDMEYHLIPPLSLLTFVENIFKYGNLRNADFPALISIDVSETEIYFKTLNQITTLPLERSGDKVGIKNAESRLKNYYKDKFSLSITNGSDNFGINLKIQL
jgi:two-component system LytT family sensor kinase